MNQDSVRYLALTNQDSVRYLALTNQDSVRYSNENIVLNEIWLFK